MADGITIQAQGLRALIDRINVFRHEKLYRAQDAMLTDVGLRLKDRLREAAPVGKTTPHLADMFAVQPVQRSGATATLRVTNAKTVQGGGKTYNLLQLVTEGTRPHDIPNVFGFGQWFTAHHPGTRPNPFVKRVLDEFNPAGEVAQFARTATAELSGETGV